MLSLKATLYVAGVAGVAFLGLAYYALYQHGEITTLQAKLDTEKLRTSTTKNACQVAQASDTETIKALVGANAQCVVATAAVAASGTEAVARAERDRKEGWAAYYQLQREQETLYANDPACRAWADQPLCPAVAERLRRERAAASPSAD